jgi:hypothetical protein
VYENADDDAILLFVSAVDDAKEVDRRFAHHLEAAAEPGLSRKRPGSDQTLIGQPSRAPGSPLRQRTPARSTISVTNCLIASGEKFGSSSAASTAA